MKKGISMLLSAAVLGASLLAPAGAAEAANTKANTVQSTANQLHTNENYTIIIPWEDGRGEIFYASLENNFYAQVCENREAIALYDFSGNKLLEGYNTSFHEDFFLVWPKKNSDSCTLYNYDLEELCTLSNIGRIKQIEDKYIYVVQLDNMDWHATVSGQRYLYDLHTGKLVSELGPGAEYDEFSLPDGSKMSVSFQSGEKVIIDRNSTSRLKYKKHDYGTNVINSRQRIIETCNVGREVNLYENGTYYSVSDWRGPDADLEHKIIYLKNADGDVVIPVGTFIDLKKITVDDGTHDWVALCDHDGNWGLVQLNEFQPTPSAWAAERVAQATVRGYVPEDTQKWWRDSCTREEFCEILMNALDDKTGETEKQETQKKFSDCANPDVLRAAELGIVQGKGNDIFEPDAYITRQEAACFLARTAAYLHLSANGEQTDFPDAQEIDDWAKESVQTVSSLYDKEGVPIMQGMGNHHFAPLQNYTVEQAVVTILRLLEVEI